MNDLSRKILGRTGLEVTALGYGAMELRGVPFGGPEITDDQAKLILNAVLDEGINYIDTSIDYGRSEEFIGKYIAHRRSEYYLASKCGCVPGERGKHVHTATNIRAGVEHSLSLMKTDYLDVVQFHSSLPRTELEGEALDTVVALQQEGRCGSSACLVRCPIWLSKWRWTPLMSFRFRTLRWSVSTRPL